MDQSAYVKRLEAAIFQSSEAMKILRSENTSLLTHNNSLKQRVSELENEIRDLQQRPPPPSTLSQSHRPARAPAPASTTLSARNKRAFAGDLMSSIYSKGVPTEDARMSVQSAPTIERATKIPKQAPTGLAFPLQVAKVVPDSKTKADPSPGCDNLTLEEQELADEIDKDFDELFSTSSDSDDDDDNNDEESVYDKENGDSIVMDEERVDSEFDSSSESDSDLDLADDVTSHTETTTFIEDEDEDDADSDAGDEQKWMQQSTSAITDTSLSRGAKGKEGVEGHEAIDLTGLVHTNLQILHVLENLSMKNVHTASLLLCKFSVAPVCEILCKHIKSTAKAEAHAILSKGELNNLNMSLKEDQPVGVANSDIDTDADIDWEGGTSASSTYSAFRDQILALLTSIAARVQSNGPSLCRRILLMMHDNLWLTWFPTDSPSLTAGWTRKGIFELQELVFFGCNSTSNVGDAAWTIIPGDGCLSTDMICELFTVFVIHIGHKQGLCDLMESVLRSYAYVSQQMPLLGTTVGIIRALQANNIAPLTDLSMKSDNLSPKIFQANNIVNELFLNFNSCNLFVVAKIMAETVEHCSKTLIVRRNHGVRFLSALFLRYCESLSTSSQEDALVQLLEKDTISGVVRNGDADARTTARSIALSKYIENTYSSYWRENSDGGNLRKLSFQNVISKWMKPPRKFSAHHNVRSSPINDEEYRFSVDMFMNFGMNSTGLWNRMHKLQCENYSNDCKSRQSVFATIGIENVDVVVEEVLYLHNRLKCLVDDGDSAIRYSRFTNIFKNIIRPCGSDLSRETTAHFVVPTQPGVENVTIEHLTTFWKSQLTALLKTTTSDDVFEPEITIVQNFHLITNILKNGTVPFHVDSSSNLKRSNEEEILQSSFAKCKRLLLQLHVQLPPGVEENLTTTSVFDTFKAVSISPALMRKSVVMLNYCMTLLSDESNVMGPSFADAVSELADNVTHAIFELMIYLSICSLRALVRAARQLVVSTMARCSIQLRRMSTECILILLHLHDTCFVAHNKNCLMADVTETMRSFHVNRVSDNAIELKPILPRDSRRTFFPPSISSWLWKQSYRKIPAFVINLDIRDDRWKKLLANCCDHGILPTRVAAIDARRGHQSMIYGAESRSENTSSTTNIPPEVVALKWDSTTNAKFDIKCRVNTSTPLTPSERACAASHVITWKLIYDIFAKKSMTPPSQLTSYISSSVNTVGRIQNGGEQFKRNGFTPLPSRRVYDSIPDLWISSPRPEYQRHIFTAEERQAQIDSVSDFLAIRNQSSVEHYGNFFLILEDDAVVDPHPKVKGKYSHPQCKKLVKKNFLQRLKEIEDKIPADFDICYLGYNGKSYKKLVKKILVRPQYVWQLHAYLLSPKGAAKLLTQLPVSAPVDNFIAKLIYEKQLEAYAVPMDAQLVKQAGTFKSRQASSDIAHSSSMR